MQNIFFYRPTYPIFFRTITGNKQFIFLGLSITDPSHKHIHVCSIECIFTVKVCKLLGYHANKALSWKQTIGEPVEKNTGLRERFDPYPNPKNNGDDGRSYLKRRLNKKCMSYPNMFFIIYLFIHYGNFVGCFQDAVHSQQSLIYLLTSGASN